MRSSSSGATTPRSHRSSEWSRSVRASRRTRASPTPGSRRRPHRRGSGDATRTPLCRGTARADGMGARRARQARPCDGQEPDRSSSRDCRARLPARLSERSRGACSRRGGGRQPAIGDPRGAPRCRCGSDVARTDRLLGDLLARAGQTAEARRQRATVSVIDRLLEANGVQVDFVGLVSRDNLIRPAETVELARRARADRPSIYGDDALGWALARAGRCVEALPLTERALLLGTRIRSSPTVVTPRAVPAIAPPCATGTDGRWRWSSFFGSLVAGCPSGPGPLVADRGRIIGA